ncbi:MAG TPA: flagellar hook-basal body complex protein FliE [Hyphomicrobiales bacterium]|nr:flagellar hook-basal body complex protein FliE [Hyphomicrobiales bacterium]
MNTAAFAAGAYRRLATIGTGEAAGAAKPGAAAAGGESFSGLLQQALDTVADSAKRADTQALAAAQGKANLVDVVTAVAESQTAVQALIGVRDRVISAYQQIMQMPI